MARLVPLRSRRASPNCSDPRSRRIAEHVVLDVYWLDFQGRSGPAASLYVYDDEVLRFDCFDGDAAHLHANRKQSRAFASEASVQLLFPPGSFEGHIERACFELTSNLPHYLARNFSPRVRRTQLDPAAMVAAADFLRVEMQTLLRQHDSGNKPSDVAEPIAAREELGG